MTDTRAIVHMSGVGLLLSNTLLHTDDGWCGQHSILHAKTD